MKGSHCAQNDAQKDKTMGKRNRIIVRDTGDYENVLEGGYTSIHEVLRCKVDCESGILEYETVAFPSFPSFVNTAVTKDDSSRLALQAGRVHHRHVSSMERLNDEEIEELRSQGIKIRILPKKR